MLCGVFAIVLAFAGRIDIAPYFIFLAAVLDFFDGFMARILKQQGELGKQLDSLADMISFGLAPGIIILAVLVYALFPIESFFALPTGEHYSAIPVYASVWRWEGALFYGKQLNAWAGEAFGMLFIPFAALIIPFFSMFRLAKFNIDTRQSESFIGVPTPANTNFFMAFPLLVNNYWNTTGWEHDLIMWLIQPMVLLPIIIIMSVLLVSELPLFALKFKTFKWQGNEIRYIFLISCGILIPTLLFWSIPIIVLLYLLLSFIHNTLRKKSNA